MRFRGFRKSFISYHNILVIFYRIANRIEFTKFTSIGGFQVSLITVQKHKIYFLQELFACNTNCGKFLKLEILMQHRSVSFVYTRSLCGSWSPDFANRSRKMEKTAIDIQKQEPEEPRLTIP